MSVPTRQAGDDRQANPALLLRELLIYARRRGPSPVAFLLNVHRLSEW
jgi:hypothetical protein